MTLRRRITLFVALAVVVPITAVVVQMFVLLRNEDDHRARQRVITVLQSAVQVLGDRHARLRVTAAEGAGRLQTVPDESLSPALADLVALATLDAAAIVDDGRVVASSVARAPEGLTVEPQEALTGDAPALLSASAVLEGRDDARLVVGVWLDRQLLTTLFRTEDVRLAVAVGEEVLAATSEQLPNAMVRPGELREREVAGRTLVVGAERLPGVPGAVLVASTGAGGTGLLDGQVGLVLILVLLVIVLLIVLVGYVVSGLVTHPVQELVAAAGAVAAGDLDRRVSAKGDAEVAALGRAFNDMTANLKEQLEALEESRRQFRQAIARLGDVLAATIDLQGIIDAVVEVTALTTRADVVIFYDFVASPGRVRARAVHGQVPGAREAFTQLDLNGTGAAGAAARLRSPVTVPGSAELDAAEPEVESALAVPLVIGTRLHSVLAVYGRSGGGRFTPEDEETLLTLALQANVAIENAQLHAEVKQQALTDGLTGLYNRRAFEQRAADELHRAERFDDPVGVVMVDIDHFKAVNDTYDHVTGDAALIEVASRIHAAVRDIDTVARWGGEEFALLLPRAGLEETALVAERVRTLVAARPLDYENHAIPITVSVGYACRPEHGKRPKELVLLADHALQRAKRRGRNRVERADPDEAQEDDT